MAALHGPLSSSLLDFIDSCLFSSGFALKVYVLYTGILSSYNKFFFYLSPKQKVFQPPKSIPVPNTSKILILVSCQSLLILYPQLATKLSSR